MLMAGLMLIVIVAFYLLFGLLILFSDSVIHQQDGSANKS